MMFPGIKEFLKKYQARAEKAGRRSAGLLPAAVGLRDRCRCWARPSRPPRASTSRSWRDYIRATEFDTIVGKVKFGKNGEWAKGRTLMVQYQKIQGTDIDQFRGPGKKVVLYPDELKSGNIIYPYAGGEELERALPVLLGPAGQRGGRRAAARGLLCRRQPRRLAHLRAARHRQHRAARVRDPRLLRGLRDEHAPSASIPSWRAPLHPGLLSCWASWSIASTTRASSGEARSRCAGLVFFFGLLFIMEVSLSLAFGVDYRLVAGGVHRQVDRPRRPSASPSAISCPASSASR